ncbi:MAG: alanine--tRNA ligase-related protein [Patescibacteria group bacterium]
MTSAEIRKKFIEYFASHGHTAVASSSLLPDDPSVLLTTAGMQQFKPYYTRAADPQKDFGALNTVSIQKCFRTSDIDEVGDSTHLTFFEMLGNFSFGGYMKKEAITYAYELLTQELKLPISYVTIFKGSHGVPKDEESRAIWQSLGVADVREEGIDDVFWGPTGTSGPCGPTTEIYCKNAEGKDVEIWNIVFNQFFYPGSREELLAQNPDKKLEPLEIPGVDTGMGFERLVMTVQQTKDLYETDLFAPFLDLLPETVSLRHKRIFIDHLRGSSFLLADGVRPSNKGAGYILRRLMRRVLAYEYLNELGAHVADGLVHDIVHEYAQFYPELLRENDAIRIEWDVERAKFKKTIAGGMKALEAACRESEITAMQAFDLYQSFGLPYEIIKEIGGAATERLTLDAFTEEFRKHQEASRAGLEKKFGGHGLLLDTGELKAKDEEELKKVTRLHSATHLVQAALRKVLGEEVHQMGSDITVERTRFDFSFPRKLDRSEIEAVEKLVNEAIERDLTVVREELPYEEAMKRGALHFFKEKYPQKVSIYTFSDPSGVFSMEFCGGPHVTHTKEIGKFAILKEEASSAGVRRIRAAVYP